MVQKKIEPLRAQQRRRHRGQRRLQWMRPGQGIVALWRVEANTIAAQGLRQSRIALVEDFKWEIGFGGQRSGEIIGLQQAELPGAAELLRQTRSQGHVRGREENSGR